MNLYGGPIEEYFNENEHVKGNGKASSEMHPTAASKCAMRKAGQRKCFALRADYGAQEQV
jgi:hypothetical protein